MRWGTISVTRVREEHTVRQGVFRVSCGQIIRHGSTQEVMVYGLVMMVTGLRGKHTHEHTARTMNCEDRTHTYTHTTRIHNRTTTRHEGRTGQPHTTGIDTYTHTHPHTPRRYITGQPHTTRTEQDNHTHHEDSEIPSPPTSLTLTGYSTT